jgi:hypothetical protein
MADPEFRNGEIDIQFLDRRADLLGIKASAERAGELAVAAALAEDEARQARRPAVTAAADGTTEWARQARREGLR